MPGLFRRRIVAMPGKTVSDLENEDSLSVISGGHEAGSTPTFITDKR